MLLRTPVSVPGGARICCGLDVKPVWTTGEAPVSVRCHGVMPRLAPAPRGARPARAEMCCRCCGDL